MTEWQGIDFVVAAAGAYDTPAKAVEKLMLDNLLPIGAEDTNEFRNRFLYTEEVNDTFSEHIALVRTGVRGNLD